MNTKPLTAILLLAFVAGLPSALAAPLVLSGSRYTNTFDDLQAQGASLEPGWSLYSKATDTSPGLAYTWSIANYSASSNSWLGVAGRFANQASTYSYLGKTNFLGTESTSIQAAEPNRCLGLRQSSSFGDPGGAFVLQLQDTLNRQNFQLYLDALNLDDRVTRATTWTVDYGFGDAPSDFMPLTTFVNPVGGFSTTRKIIPLPNGTIDNHAGPVWLRFVALTATSGSGNRQVFGLDNFGLSWTAGATCIPATFTLQPTNASVFVRANVGFSVLAIGTEPVSFVWVKDGTRVLTDDGHYFGANTRTLTITNVQLSDQGTYTCLVSNVCSGTVYAQVSTPATLTVTVPPAVSIGYLRTLVDAYSFAPTNLSLVYQVTGIITTVTNIAGPATASYYLQDDTGGINLYAPASPTFRPSQGDEVTAVGRLWFEFGNLEFLSEAYNPTHSLNILSNNLARYPVAQVVPWDHLALGGTDAALNYSWAGSLVMLTDVHFGTNAGVRTPSAATLTCVVTNSAGKVARLYFPCTQVNDLTNRTLPAFAYAVQGPLLVTPSGYAVMPTCWRDVLTTPLRLAVNRSGASPRLTWTAVPLTYSYTVLGATNVAGPYAVLASGLRFADANGAYTDTGAEGNPRFYRVTSP